MVLATIKSVEPSVAAKTFIQTMVGTEAYGSVGIYGFGGASGRLMDSTV
jgi:hypothetical protein